MSGDKDSRIAPVFSSMAKPWLVPRGDPRNAACHLSIRILRLRGVVFRSDGADLLQGLRPSFAHPVERKIILWRAEAGMHQANPRAAVDLGERPFDDRL